MDLHLHLRLDSVSLTAFFCRTELARLARDGSTLQARESDNFRAQYGCARLQTHLLWSSPITARPESVMNHWTVPTSWVALTFLACKSWVLGLITGKMEIGAFYITLQ
jgi:hypothetical protein